MKTDVKKLISEFSELCQKTLGRDVSSELNKEIIDFLSYLSASDGKFAVEETDFLHSFLGKTFSPDELKKHITENNIYSTDFEKKTPAVFSELIETDNKKCSKCAKENYSTSLAYIEMFTALGKEFLASDGETTENEVKDFNIYLGNLKEIYKTKYSGAENAKCACLTKESEPEESTLNALLDELNSLIGLQSVKNEITGLIHLQEIRRIRKQRGLKDIPISNHIVFYGNPGTGKTTVARIIAKIYKQIGLLSRDTLIEVDREGLVGGYIGQTAIKTKGVINKALGGVLFIDEAYSLASSDSCMDYGREAIETLLKAMEDHRDSLVVIVAGYTGPMQKFLNSNPGFRSRFNKYIVFPDYTPEELFQIFCLFCKESGYIIENDAKDFIAEVLKNKYDNRGENFANGREVRNVFERIVTVQAGRLFEKNDVSNEELTTITKKDIEKII